MAKTVTLEIQQSPGISRVFIHMEGYRKEIRMCTLCTEELLREMEE